MEHWSAVGVAITERLSALRMTQQQLAVASGISPATIRELQHGRRRATRGRTLSALSAALGWPTDYLTTVLRGEPAPAESTSSERDPVLAELGAIRTELRELREQVAGGTSVESLRQRVIDHEQAASSLLGEISARLDALERGAASEPPKGR